MFRLTGLLVYGNVSGVLRVGGGVRVPQISLPLDERLCWPERTAGNQLARNCSQSASVGSWTRIVQNFRRKSNTLPTELTVVYAHTITHSVVKYLETEYCRLPTFWRCLTMGIWRTPTESAVQKQQRMFSASLELLYFQTLRSIPKPTVQWL